MMGYKWNRLLWGAWGEMISGEAGFVWGRCEGCLRMVGTVCVFWWLFLFMVMKVLKMLKYQLFTDLFFSALFGSKYNFELII